MKTNRYTLRLALLTMLCLPLCAVAGPGDGIRVGKLALSPFVNATLTYDSNVFLEEEDEKDDLFFDIMFGLSAAEHFRSVSLSARAWYMIRQYQEYTEKDHDEWGESASIGIGSVEKTLLEVSQRFRRTEDYERTPGSVEYVNPENQTLILSEDRTMRVPRELNDIGVSLTRRLGEKTYVMVSGAFNGNDYDSQGLYDWTEGTYMAQLTRKLTDKTSATLSGSYGSQSSDGLTGSVDFYSLNGGVTMRRSAKLHLDASGGMSWYHAPDGTGPERPGFIDFNVAARWLATENWTLQMSSRNGMQPASQFKNDTMKVTLFSLSAERPIKTSWLFSMTGAYRYDLYHNTPAPGGPSAPEDTGEIQNDARSGESWSRQWAGHVRLDYRPVRKPYNLFAEVRYEDTESVWFEYVQLRATLGLALRY